MYTYISYIHVCDISVFGANPRPAPLYVPSLGAFDTTWHWILWAVDDPHKSSSSPHSSHYTLHTLLLDRFIFCLLYHIPIPHPLLSPSYPHIPSSLPPTPFVLTSHFPFPFPFTYTTPVLCDHNRFISSRPTRQRAHDSHDRRRRLLNATHGTTKSWARSKALKPAGFSPVRRERETYIYIYSLYKYIPRPLLDEASLHVVLIPSQRSTYPPSTTLQNTQIANA